MKNKKIIFGIILCFLSIVIFTVFYNPYPCNNSGIGCSSLLEGFLDNLNVYIGLILMMFGIYFIYDDLR